jgi:tRNA (cmo5U34)-methyltransferase
MGVPQPPEENDNSMGVPQPPETEAVESLMWQRYGEYLNSAAGDTFRKLVFDCIGKEDSPRPVTYQLDLLRRVGFSHVELLHKNSCFASFGAIKEGELCVPPDRVCSR